MQPQAQTPRTVHKLARWAGSSSSLATTDCDSKATMMLREEETSSNCRSVSSLLLYQTPTHNNKYDTIPELAFPQKSPLPLDHSSPRDNDGDSALQQLKSIQHIIDDAFRILA